MDLSDAKKAYIKSVKIPLGNEGGEIELREASVLEAQVFAGAKEENFAETLASLLPALIVSHDLYDGEKKASAAQVVELVLASPTLFALVSRSLAGLLSPLSVKEGSSAK